MPQKVPKFKSIQEEAEWWDKTDTSAWMHEGEWVPAGTGRLAEERCPVCYSRRQARRFNLRVANGRVTLHRVKGYYCPKCKTTEPARSVQKQLARLEQIAEKVVA